MNNAVIEKRFFSEKNVKNLLSERFKIDSPYFKTMSPINRSDEFNPVIILSYNCNYACQYCYQSSYKSKKEKILPEMVGKINYFCDLYRKQTERHCDISEISVMGGEPFLPENEETLWALYREWPDCKFLVTTNGTFIHYFSDLLENMNVSIKVSVDGTKEIHSKRRKSSQADAYDKTIRGIMLLLEKKIATRIVTVFHPEDSKEYSKFFDLLESLGWLTNPFLSIGFIPEIGCGCDDISNERVIKNIQSFVELKQKDPRTSYVDARKLIPGSIRLENAIRLSQVSQYDPYRCGALDGTMITFLPDGSVHTCIAVPDGQDKIVTYAPETRFDFEKFKILNERRIDKYKKCMKCKKRVICGGGCLATAVKKTGSLTGTDCELWENTDYLKYWEDIYWR